MLPPIGEQPLTPPIGLVSYHHSRYRFEVPEWRHLAHGFGLGQAQTDG